MFCTNCGASIPDDSKFCDQCGTTCETPDSIAAGPPPEADSFVPAPEQQPAPEAQVQPASTAVAVAEYDQKQQGEKQISPMLKNKNMLMIWGAVVACCVLVAVILIPLLSSASPKSFVMSSMSNTMKTLAKESEQINKELGIATVFEDVWSRPTEETFSLGIKNLPASPYADMSIFEDSKITLTTQQDLKGKQVAAQVKADIAGQSFTAKLQAKGDVMALSLPELLGTKYYGIDISTFVRDYNDSIFGEYDPLPFDEDQKLTLFNSGSQTTLFNKQETQEMQKFASQLISDVTFARDGKETVDINGESVKTNRVIATVPSKSLITYTNSWLKLMGKNDAFVQGFMTTSGSGMSYSETIEESITILEEIMTKDVTVEFYIADKKVVKILADLTLGNEYGGRIVLQTDIQIGGKGNMIDAFSFTEKIRIDDQMIKFSLTSTGNHIPEKGVFTDTTEMRYTQSNATYNNFVVTLNTEYNAKEKTDNLTFDAKLKISGDEASCKVRASVDAQPSKKTLEATLDSLTFGIGGMDFSEMFSLKGSYSIAPLKSTKDTFTGTENARMILSMSEADLQDLAQELLVNAMMNYGEVLQYL